MHNDHLIPSELKRLPQWVLWRLEKRDGKPTKLPYQTNGNNAESNNAATWNTYANVCKKCESDPTYSGIGFTFSQDDPYTGIDLDDAIDANGQTKDWAAQIIGKLNSYTEISPSGTGVKIWIKGKLPLRPTHKTTGRRAKYEDGEIEMYDSGRYFTVTGQRYGIPEDVQHRQAELDELYAEVFPEPEKLKKTKPPKQKTNAVRHDLTDDVLIDKAKSAANGEKFSNLWNGQIAEYGEDDSRADLALCSLLAYWTGDDAHRIDRLFRQSQLMREKWLRDDYREATVGKAINGLRTVNTEDGGGSHPDCLPPTDLGNARRLHFRYGNELRHVAGIGWHIWTGRNWQPDLMGDVMNKAKTVAVTIPHEVSKCRRKKDGKSVSKWAITSESLGKLNAMVELASTDPRMAVMPDRLDANPWLFNCLSWQKNGLREPDEVKQATQEYRDESDPMGDFIEDKCIVADNAWVATSILYQSYFEHTKANGDYPVNSKNFATMLTKKHFTPKKRSGQRGWQGIALNTEKRTADVDDDSWA